MEFGEPEETDGAKEIWKSARPSKKTVSEPGGMARKRARLGFFRRGFSRREKRTEPLNVSSVMAGRSSVDNCEPERGLNVVALLIRGELDLL